LTSGQQHTGNITSGLFGQPFRHPCLCNEKIKTSPLHKNKLNFYGNRTSGTFGVAPMQKANPLATPKEPLFANASNGGFFIRISNFGL
jgi:hypothetical protein